MANSLFGRMFRVKVTEVLESRTAQITTGVPQDYAAYREGVGYIRGLMDALTIAEDVEREPDERSDSA